LKNPFKNLRDHEQRREMRVGGGRPGAESLDASRSRLAGQPIFHRADRLVSRLPLKAFLCVSGAHPLGRRRELHPVLIKFS
jgi:hypothetical protein